MNKTEKEGITKGVKVIFSDEVPVKTHVEVVEYVGNSKSEIRKAQNPPSSTAFVPSVSGLIAARWVIRDIIE